MGKDPMGTKNDLTAAEGARKKLKAIKKELNDDLIWLEKRREKLFDAKIFSLCRVESVSPFGVEKEFSVIESGNWAIVVPLLAGPGGNELVMVKQWRHGAGELSVEFPGGVVEAGEDVERGARRELREETGYAAGKMTLLASMNPNPAIMCNRVHFFLAEELRREGALELDGDEFLEVVRTPVAEAVAGMGKAPYIHALMAAALCHCLLTKRDFLS